MKTIRNFSKFFAVVALLAMVLSFAACKPALKLESFTVDRSTVKTTYNVGDEVDFSGIKATAKYNDETLNKTYTKSELTIEYANDITATAGDKEVTVSFMDPNLNVKQTTKFTITVKGNGEVTPDLTIAVGFERPADLTAFNAANTNAGTLQPDQAGFQGQFLIGGIAYVIGNENEFRLNPTFSVMNDQDEVVAIDKFYSVIDIFVMKDGEYAKLTATKGENNLVSYYDGETLVVTVDTFEGTYQFAANFNGNVKISVLPSEEHYIFDDLNPVVLEAKVINAYNVYEAWQLAVIDNSSNIRDIWDSFKSEKGIANVTVSGIVLHNDISITANDVPDDFFYVTEEEVVYKNSVTKEETILPVGTKFLKESVLSELSIYYRNSTDNFVFEGNFFTIDTKTFPHVASPAVFGSSYPERNYGSDFSNMTLFRFQSADSNSVVSEAPTVVANVKLNNIQFIGNSSRDNLVDADGYLASAGGLILLKSSYFTKAEFNNIVSNSFFITYFPEHADITVDNAKCYDSYQNAAFVWGLANLTVKNSYVSGTGGPIVIAQSLVEYDDSEVNLAPKVDFTNTVCDSHLTGEEVWFSAVQASPVISKVKAIGNQLSMIGLGNFVDANGKMNIKGALMLEGNDFVSILSNVGVQGSMMYDNKGIDRFLNADNTNWQAIYGISTALQQAGLPELPAFFTVMDAEGNAQTIFTDGTNLYDLAQNVITPQTHGALLATFATADTLTLTQGGLSVTFEFYHGSNAYTPSV